MTDDTPTALDRARARMDAAPEDTTARLGYYRAVADSELLVLLAAEPEGDRVEPELFPVEGARYVMAFDSEERLAAFADRPVPYIGIPGRALVRLLAPEGLGLGINVGVAPSSMLVPPEGVAWLVQTLDAAPDSVGDSPVAFAPPGDAVTALAPILSAPLAAAGAGGAQAWLAEALYPGGTTAPLLAVVGVPAPLAEDLARAVQEAIAFSGADAAGLDVAFLDPDAPAAREIAAVGQQIEMPATTPAAPEKPDTPAAPGMDPEKPPRLR